MAVGSISSIGIGSGLELQSILDQLREVDEQAQLDPKRERKAELEKRLDEFTVVKNKVLDIKSAALTLSLSSTFNARTIESSDTAVMTASVLDSTATGATSVTVDRLASKSSWLSDGLASADSIVYVPTSQESTTGVADPAAGAVMLEGETLTITFAGTTTISLTAPSGGWTMNDLVTQINDHADNQGGPGDNGRYVTAETYTVGTDTYLRIRSDTSGGTGEANRVEVSETLTGLDFEPPVDVFQYQVGSDVVTLNVAADTTLAELAALINDDADNPGVTASVIDDGSGTNSHKLLLQADETGEDHRVSVTTQLDDLAMNEEQGAGGASLNAQVTIEGISYQRQTNTISDVLTGITMNLAATGSTTLTVSGSNDSVKGLIKDMVEAYNAATQELRSNTAYDEETGEFGILAGTSLRDLAFDLQDLMTSTVRADSEGKVTTLFDLGLEFERDGTISIDEETLDSVIADSFDNVQAFFLGDDGRGVTGMADLINDRLRAVTSGSGQIEGEKTATSEMISDLEDQMERISARLDRRYEILSKQFVELDRYMSQMTALSDYLTSQFDSLSKSAGGSSGSK